MRIKAVGLAVVMAAALAVSVGAASASASGFSAFAEGTGAEHYPATISGSLKSGGSITWGGVATAMCTPGTTSGNLSGPAKSLAVSPSCGTQIQLNGCQVTVNSGAETSPGVFAATVDIGGAGCSSISIQTEVGGPKCSGTISPQSGVTGSTLTNVSGSPDEVELSLSAGLKGTGGGGALGCPKAGQATTGYWSGTWRLAADSGGEARDLRVQSAIARGVAVEEGQFVGETYPMSVVGNQAVSSVAFRASSGFAAITCSKAQFGSTLASAASSLTAGAEYSGCTDSMGRPVTVAMNSCSYVFNVSGALGVSCGTPGDSIAYQVKNGSGVTICTATVPAQSSSGLSYATSGAGYAATIQMTSAAESLTTNTSGGLLNCGVKNGTHSDGQFTGGIKLVGSSQYS